MVGTGVVTSVVVVAPVPVHAQVKVPSPQSQVLAPTAPPVAGVVVTGVVVTGIVVTGVVVTGIVVTGIVVTGIVVTGVVGTGVVAAGVVVTGIVVAGVVVAQRLVPVDLRKRSIPAVLASNHGDGSAADMSDRAYYPPTFRERNIALKLKLKNTTHTRACAKTGACGQVVSGVAVPCFGVCEKIPCFGDTSR